MFFAGGGFNTDDPGSLLDHLAKAKPNELGGPTRSSIHYLAVPPVRVHPS